ncbi:MAG: HDOD domain-containing protein [Deltaproteobacteria bacterium]|nr:HDOD domain-containing protein [Deltaproteobacteria bacterium]
MTTKEHPIVAQVEKFPGMPGAAVKLLTLVDDPDVSIAQIESILRQDPGLTANLLRLANSAYFGIPSKVGSVRQAVILLGLKRMVQMVIATCTSAIMDRTVPGYDLPAGELWRHSLAVSVAAEGLVRALKLDGGEEVFTAALLHDVGKIILGQFVHNDYVKIALALDQGLPFETAESIVLGTNHAEVGAQVLSKWSLPEGIVHAVRWHHEPEQAQRIDPIMDVVHVANMLCLMIGIGVGREGLNYRPSPVVTKRLGITTSHLEKVASQTLQWANELSQALAA